MTESYINQAVDKFTSFTKGQGKSMLKLTISYFLRILSWDSQLLLPIPPGCLTSLAREPHYPKQPFHSLLGRKKVLWFLFLLKTLSAGIAILIGKRSSAVLSGGDTLGLVLLLEDMDPVFGFRKPHQLRVNRGYSQIPFSVLRWAG